MFSKDSLITNDMVVTTPLTSLQLVLGSLAGHLCPILIVSACGVALLELVFIQSGELAFAFLVSAAALLPLAAWSTYLTIIWRSQIRILMTCIGAILFYPAVWYGIKALLLELSASRVLTFFQSVHPLGVLDALSLTSELEGLRSNDGERLGALYIASIVITIGGVLAACIAVRSSPEKRGILKRPLTRPPEIVSRNPVAWREVRYCQKCVPMWLRHVYLWGSIGLTAVLLFTYEQGVLPLREKGVSLKSLLTLLLVAQMIMATVVAMWLGSTGISREREGKTLTFLLATLVTPRAVVVGKLGAMLRVVLFLTAAPVASLMVVGGYLFVFHWQEMRYSYVHVWTTIDIVPLEVPGGRTWIGPLIAVVLTPFVILWWWMARRNNRIPMTVRRLSRWRVGGGMYWTYVVWMMVVVWYALNIVLSRNYKEVTTDITRVIGQWVILPEALVLLPLLMSSWLVMVTVICFDISLGAASARQAAAKSGILVLIIGTLTSACAWSWFHVDMFGSNASALNPLTGIVLLLYPTFVNPKVDYTGVGTRIYVFASVVGATIIYATLAWAWVQGMVRNYDSKVRRSFEI